MLSCSSCLSLTRESCPRCLLMAMEEVVMPAAEEEEVLLGGARAGAMPSRTSKPSRAFIHCLDITSWKGGSPPCHIR